ncbi:MAG: molybdenum cofactor biosynthesis protein MoaE [Solirubrobacterales bacterium]
MVIKVRLFAGLREAGGTECMDVELGDDHTATGLLQAMRAQPGLGDLLERLPVRVAVNSTYVSGDTVIRDGDEVALVPPISGGSQIRASVTAKPLDIASISAEAGDPAAGAVVVFQGVTREVAHLDYEAYAEMAEKRIGQILIETVERFGLTGAVAEHRTGVVPLGESSVIVAVSSPHRPEAFEAAKVAIDRIKEEVPIWKVEVEADGSTHRVEGSLPQVDQQEMTSR